MAFASPPPLLWLPNRETFIANTPDPRLKLIEPASCLLPRSQRVRTPPPPPCHPPARSALTSHMSLSTVLPSSHELVVLPSELRGYVRYIVVMHPEVRARLAGWGGGVGIRLERGGEAGT